jgi:hypothetical protein
MRCGCWFRALPRQPSGPEPSTKLVFLGTGEQRGVGNRQTPCRVGQYRQTILGQQQERSVFRAFGFRPARRGRIPYAGKLPDDLLRGKIARAVEIGNRQCRKLFLRPARDEIEQQEHFIEVALEQDSVDHRLMILTRFGRGKWVAHGPPPMDVLYCRAFDFYFNVSRFNVSRARGPREVSRCGEIG